MSLEVYIKNTRETEANCNYIVVAGHPTINDGNIQPSAIQLPVACKLSNVGNGNRKNFTYSETYYAFVGELKIFNHIGLKTISPIMDMKVRLGGLQNDGSRIYAGFKKESPGSVKMTQKEDEPKPSDADTFTIMCQEEAPEGSNYVVGLAQEIDNDVVPVAAVPYMKATEYVIRPSPNLYVLMSMKEKQGHVLDQSKTVVRIEFPVGKSKTTLLEDNFGNFKLLLQGPNTTTLPKLTLNALGGEQPQPRPAPRAPQPAPRKHVPKGMDEVLNEGFKSKRQVKSIFSVLKLSSGSC
jgi:hypothetical protein